ncbi:hypothetical protein P7C70_g7988, partial [Phenoliferia sp. Uapishka_3]
MNEKEFLLGPVRQTPKASRLRRAVLGGGVVAGLVVAAASLLRGLEGAGLYASSPSRVPVDWTPCPANVDFQCGYLEVPKNYFNLSAGTAQIAMLKVPSTAPPSERLGTIFLNPGGPGGSGVEFALRFGPSFSKLLRGRYDLLGFDPRGIGASIPRVECFPSTLEHELFKAGTVLERGFDLSKVTTPFKPCNPFSATGRLHLLDQHRQLQSLQQTQFELCGERMGDDLNYMGTSTVVRDIEEMSRVLEGDALINFFGGSYGTILGAYLVNMIPEKVGRVLIDGVASAPQWANEPTYKWLADWLAYTEKTFDWFLEDCSKARQSSYCIFEQPADNFPSLIGRANELSIGEKPPGSWPHFAQVFADALAGNATSLYNELVKPLHLNFPSHIQVDLSRAAVSCIDSPPYKSPKDWPTAEIMVEETLHVLETASRHFGASINLIEPDGGCQYWPATSPPERFIGPWNATLKTPMLIVSNTADPITPLSSGRELNDLMGPSSRLLIQNSPGHCSLGSVSRCTMTKYRDYFLDGVLPPDEFMCEVDERYFPGGEDVRSVGLMDDLARDVSKAWRGYLETL